jgi:Ala-tRNA(Pro) deacylase
MEDRKLESYLNEHGITYVSVKHPAVFTVEESKKHREIFNADSLHCKTLFLKDEKGKFYLIGMPANKRLDTKKLEQHLQVKKIRFASAEELLREIHLTPGSVSIFGIIYSSRTYFILDEEVWKAKLVGFHPNINTETLEIKHKNLEKFYNSLTNKKEIIAI